MKVSTLIWPWLYIQIEEHFQNPKFWSLLKLKILCSFLYTGCFNDRTAGVAGQNNPHTRFKLA